MRQELNNKLNELAAKPAKTYPVRVGERSNGDLEIVYEFPFTQEIYQLKENSQLNGLMTHIAEVIKELEVSGVSIAKIELYADLQVDKLSYQFQETEVVYDSNHSKLGESPQLTFNFVNYYKTPREFVKGEKITIPKIEKLKLNELIALKLLSIQDILSTNTTFISEIQLSPRAASYQQFLVKIIVN